MPEIDLGNSHGTTRGPTPGASTNGRELKWEHFRRDWRSSKHRVPRGTGIIKPGEVINMTEQKKQETKDSETKSRVQQEFEALPLEKKIASLLQMEAVTISEAFSYVVNSSARAFEKAGSVIEEFGAKFEQEARKATQSTSQKPGTDGTKSSTAKPKSGARKTSNQRAAKQ